MGKIGKDSGVELDESQKKEVIDEARTKGAKVHFASLMEMDICHLKNAELETKHQKNKGRVVFRGDIVKDDSGSYAVFTEQGSSASQMTAAKVMDVISRLPECTGQAADAVSAYTQVKIEGAPKLLKMVSVCVRGDVFMCVCGFGTLHVANLCVSSCSFIFRFFFFVI